MNLSSVPGFSGVRVAQSVVFVLPVIVYVFAFYVCLLFVCSSLIYEYILIHF